MNRAQVTDKAAVFHEIQTGVYERIAKAYSWKINEFDYVKPSDGWLGLPRANESYEVEVDCSRNPCEVYIKNETGGKTHVGSLPRR